MNKSHSLLSVTLFIHLLTMSAFAQELKADLVVKTGHSRSVTSVVFSPDGKVLVSAGEDTTIKLWDVSSGIELKTLFGHGSGVTCVAFSPDGLTLASASDDSTVKLWNIVSGKVEKTFGGYRERVKSVAFSPDGKMLAAAGEHYVIKLWNIESGIEVATFNWTYNLSRQYVNDRVPVIFSPNGNLLITARWDKTVKIWGVKNNEEVRTLTTKGPIVEPTPSDDSSITLSSDGRLMANSGSVPSVSLWNTNNWQERRIITSWDDSNIISLTFSPDGKTLALGTDSHTVGLWDVVNEKLSKVLTINEAGNYDEKVINSVAFSPDGKLLASGTSGGKVSLIEIESGNKLLASGNQSDAIRQLIFSHTQNILAVSSSNKANIKLWNLASGETIRNINGAEEGEFTFLYLALHPDGKTLATSGYGYGGMSKLWDITTGKELRTIRDGCCLQFTYSSDGRLLAGADGDAINVWETTGKQLRNTLRTEPERSIDTMAFSPDNKMLAGESYYYDGTSLVEVWDVQTGNKLKTLNGHKSVVGSMAFDASGNKLVVSNAWEPQDIEIWDVKSGKLSKTIRQSHGYVDEITFSPDGEKLAAHSAKGIVLWDVASGQEITSQKRIPQWVTFDRIYRTPDRDILAVGNNNRVELIDAYTGKTLTSLISLGEAEWAVVTPNGLFDASPSARKLMHYIVGLEPVSLEQMKSIYYVPGLLKKILKGEPLPDVELFTEKDLFPLAEYQQPKADQKFLSVRLTNRGGGIGQIQVLINGKEFISDARPAGFDPTQLTAVLQINIAEAPFIAGQENKVEIVTHNVVGSLNSRGSSRGAEIVQVFNYGTKAEPPHVYAIIGGISDYTGDNLDLNFAAKDAEEFAKAFELGASKLFGAGKVHIRLLTSYGDKTNAKFNVADAKTSLATKADFERAFADFRPATPNDIFIVYLAGHGVSLNINQDPNRAGGDTYLYLTQEATTTDKTVLMLERSRRAMTISSDELAELMKQNKSLKQVLVLDTCAAGAAVSSLVTKRELPADQVKAIERLKDRTGFFALMGAAADKVSYEASQYGQGLLTYSLLQGMKGAQLRENQYADVSLLFGYAQDHVPELAQNIGGIQRPLIIAPEAGGSFDIGRYTAIEQGRIDLASPKPLILKPTLQNKDLDYDDLDLTPLLRQELRNVSYVTRSGQSSYALVFVEADEMADAIKPSGSYTVQGDTINVTIRLVRNKAPVKTMTLSGNTSNKEALVKQIVAVIAQATNPSH